MKPDIKMIGLDLDGTLFNSNKEITTNVRQAIEAAIEKGVVVLAATGRPFGGVPKELLEIKGMRYALTSNGAVVVDLRTGEHIVEDCIDNDTAQKMLGHMNELDGLAEAYIDGCCYTPKDIYLDEKYYTYVSPALKAYIQKTRVPVDDVQSFVKNHPHPVEKLHMIFGDLDLRREAFSKLRALYPDFSITEATAFNMEINSGTCNKGRGLVELGKKLGIDVSQIMACGDAGNDIVMLNTVGFAVAMGNASDDVKEIADFVTKTNNEDGVAYAIRKFVLEENE